LEEDKQKTADSLPLDHLSSSGMHWTGEEDAAEVTSSNQQILRKLSEAESLLSRKEILANYFQKLFTVRWYMAFTAASQ
jgi:hypothetical protein